MDCGAAEAAPGYDTAFPAARKAMPFLKSKFMNRFREPGLTPGGA